MFSPEANDITAAIEHAAAVGGHGLLTATDPEIFDWVIANEQVIITADSDFGALLALRRTTSPSAILLRDVADRSPQGQRTGSWSRTSSPLKNR